ncbi:cyclohexanone monooxygenase [Lentinula raphanica]|nr:cyclohexanone monooxygenase [Lentinula raphanica]
MSTTQPVARPSLDVLIVGAGFGGISAVYGGIIVILASARVDSEIPEYDLSLEEIWRDWNWTEKFPGYEELRRYFNHIDQKLEIRKDVSFNKRVVAARFDTDVNRWEVTALDGTVVNPRFLVLCTGFAAKPYTPHLKGIDLFQGISHHTAEWPENGLDLEGKRVGVIGTGASGVQVIQEIAKDVEQLTVFQPIFERRRETIAGYSYSELPSKKLFDATPAERLLHFEEQWSLGGFRFSLRNYADVVVNQAANDEVYEFWKTKVRERLHDPDMQEKLAPSIPPHPFGAKRPNLEQTVLYRRGNTRGLRYFDRGITQIDIHGLGGKSLKDKWADGVATNLGLTSADFPNMFFIYGPQAPTAFSNGPTCIEIQGDWVVNCIKYIMDNHFTYINAREEAEQQWRKKVLFLGSLTLFNKAETSWYFGSNIPGT